MQLNAMIFFFIFAVVLVGTYMAVRRGWGAPRMVAGGGVLGSIFSVTLISLAQQNSLAQAMIVGLVVGGLFSVATLLMAWYFQNSELRDRYGRMQPEEMGD